MRLGQRRQTETDIAAEIAHAATGPGRCQGIAGDDPVPPRSRSSPGAVGSGEMSRADRAIPLPGEAGPSVCVPSRDLKRRTTNLLLGHGDVAPGPDHRPWSAARSAPERRPGGFAELL